MRWGDKIALRLRSLFRRTRVEQELSDELQFHLDEQIAENVAKGMTAQQARQAALRTLGGVAQIAEECRDERGIAWFETLWQDIRYALRSLRKTPAFTAVAVLSLALGIGANTAIFSLIDTVLLKLLPVRDPQQLVFVRTRAVQVGRVHVSQTITRDDLARLQDATQIAGIAGYQEASRSIISADGKTELSAGQFVSATYFQVLGVGAALGRTLLPEDERPAAGSGEQGWPAVISEGYWQRRFGGRADVLGQRITINKVPFVIVGVSAPGFYGLVRDSQADVFMPAWTESQVRAGKVSSEMPKPTDAAGWLFARLKPGVTEAAASAELTMLLQQAELASAGTQLSEERKARIQKLSIELTPASEGENNLRERFAMPLRVLMAVVAMVMLIACANIASLLLARSTARRREIAIRLSLGSSRRRLLRQLLTESLLLSLGGAVVGIVIAIWARNAIVYLASSQQTVLPALPIEWNLRLLAFIGGICVLNAVLFGTAPSWRAAAVDCADVLKSGRSASGGQRLVLRRVLVAGQVAISLVLLVGAVLFLATLRNLHRVDLGYTTGNVLVLTLDPQLAGHDNARTLQIYQDALTRISAMPGVRSASFVNNKMLGGMLSLTEFSVPGYVPQTAAEQANRWIVFNGVGPGFFSTVQMPLVAGREFTAADNDGAPPVAVINQAFARRYFGDKNPVGQKIIRGRSKVATVEVVGIARDAKYMGAFDEGQPVVFTALLQETSTTEHQTSIIVRTSQDPVRMANDIRGIVRSIDPNLPVYDVTTMSELFAGTLVQQRMMAILCTFFGLLALGLSAIGLYGVLAYSVAQRTGEIGIRMALGADRGTILRLVLRETTQVLAAGMVAGLALTFAGARFVRTLLFGVAPTDWRSMVLAVAVLASVALIAALLPARRAVRVDPMVALRYE